MESTNTDTLRVSFYFGGFEGWWVGEKDGRVWGPRLSVSQWDQALQGTGFSGLDSVSELGDPRLSVYSVLLSQALDDRMRLLREPLSVAETEDTDTLVIIGGAENRTSIIVDNISGLLGSYFHRVTRVQTLETLHDNDLHASAVCALVLTDLDKPCFKDLCEDRLRGLQHLARVAQEASLGDRWLGIGLPLALYEQRLAEVHPLQAERRSVPVSQCCRACGPRCRSCGLHPNASGVY